MDRISIICRLLITYLKDNGVKHIVISSGTRAIPFIKAIEKDDYFICYSVVDERNAAFYALGLSQQLNQPVGLTCTSGTAASNYLSGITEAYFSHTPIVAITADRNMNVLNQLETQKIDQPAIFAPVTNKSITLPVIKDDDDTWYAKRLLDEVFLALNQHGAGPIHINLPIVGNTNDITISNSIDEELKISPLRFYSNRNPEKWTVAFDEIKGCDKILVVIGQNINLDDDTRKAISSFCHKLRIPILGDNLSNFRCEEMIFSQAPVKGMTSQMFKAVLPELVISIGNNFQERIKDFLKAYKGQFKHWLVDEGGIIRDWSKSLSALFECPDKYFFEKFNSECDYQTNCMYLNQWKQIAEASVLPEDMPWTNFYTCREFAKAIPDNSILHLAILNSTRLMQFFPLPSNIKVTCNASSFGIDGCLPTLLGQAVVEPDKLAFLLIGDLSFFYGMNALSIRNIGSNVRILVANNGGGAEFHIYPHIQKDNQIDVNIAAKHGFSAKGWAESAGFEYHSASDKKSLAEALPILVQEDSDRPIMLEVFTDLHFDGEYCLDVYHYLGERISPVIRKIEQEP